MKEQNPTVHFALLTGAKGEIRKILRDDMGMISDKLKNLNEIVEDNLKLSHFYREVAYHGAAVNWEIKLKDIAVPVRVYGGKIGNDIAVLCATDKVNLLDYINELTGINSIQTNTIRRQSKILSQQGSGDKDFLYQFSELNNTLVDLQRKLVKKNEALMRLTYQMNTVFESAGLGFVFIKPDGKIEVFNTAGRDFLNRLSHETIKAGMSVKNLAPLEEEVCIKDILLSGLNGDFLSRDIYMDGWYEVRTSPVKDDEGKQKGILLISEEISRRKNYEKTIESQKEYLFLINKILRHDLANIFTITKSATSLYKRTSDGEMLESIVEASDRGIRMIDRMKKAEKILHDPDQLRPIPLDSAIYRVMKDFKNVDYECRGKGDIYADNLIYSLLNNLVSNALRHGKATKMMFDISQETDSLILKVANNGKPIPEDIQHKVFEEHFKFGKTAHSGLGLYIVQKTTERYSGHVRVETCGEWNTCFIFTFPKILNTDTDEQ